MNELALFAGAGGGILGGKLIGWNTICAVERDGYAAQVLAQRQNDGCLEPFPIWSDVCSFDGRPWKGVVDIVSGGFPCQDISSAGKGEGIKGSRSGLWSEFKRIIEEVQPYFSFIENSPLLKTRGLDVILKDLDKIGFDAAWTVMGADEKGAPHKRNRMWILAANTKRMQEWKESRSRELGRVGRLVESFSWDGDWQDKISGFRGMGNGLARPVDRTDAIRNGQVPVVAAAAFGELFALLMEAQA